MGRWGYGPLENDTAADFAGDLVEAAAPERIGILRAALEEVVRCRGRIGVGPAETGLAAAALASGRLHGGEEFRYRRLDPREVLPPVPEDVVALAAEAVDRLLEGDNDLSDDWTTEGGHEVWRSGLEKLHSVLAGKDDFGQESLW